MKEEKIKVETVNGFDIYFEPLEEHISLRELLPEETEEQLQEVVWAWDQIKSSRNFKD